MRAAPAGAGDPGGDRPGAEAVVDVDHGDPGGAGGEHGQEGAEPAEGRPVADARGQADDRGGDEAADHGGEGGVLAGGDDDAVGAAEVLEGRGEAVEAGDADVLVDVDGRAEELGPDPGLVDGRAVGGPARDDRHAPATAAGSSGRPRRTRARACSCASGAARRTAARAAASARVTSTLAAPPSSIEATIASISLGGLALGEDRLRRALAELAVEVDAGEAEVVERQPRRAARARRPGRAAPAATASSRASISPGRPFAARVPGRVIGPD